MNVLIVESKNDKVFVEAMIRSIGANTAINTQVDSPICNIDSFECLDGLDETKLKIKILDILSDISKPGRAIQKLGILLDLDQKTSADRLDLVNSSIEKAFLENKNLSVKDLFSRINQLEKIVIDDDTQLELACHFTNYGGRRELETVLKNIKTQASDFADCLDAWRICLQDAGKTISDKDFDKFWISNYIRFDTCSNHDRRQADRKCSVRNLEYVLVNKPGIFHFNAASLSDMRDFLNLF